MPFFNYHQNNSGGSFTVDHSVTHDVIIEAKDAEHADRKAASIGIYFDGCRAGQDCECCGDRWYGASDLDRTERPAIHGEDLTSDWGPSSCSWVTGYPDRPRAIVYYADGRVCGFGPFMVLNRGEHTIQETP